MSEVRIGYDNQIELDLAALLGPGYWGRDLTVAWHVPLGEYPNFQTGAMECMPVNRRLIVIEGTNERMAPYLAALAEVHKRQTES